MPQKINKRKEKKEKKEKKNKLESCLIGFLSIVRTWVTDPLSTFKNLSGLVPQKPQAAQDRQWSISEINVGLLSI